MSFTNYLSNQSSRAVLIENNYFMAIGGITPWPTEVDTISDNLEVPLPDTSLGYIPELIGIVRVKSLQTLLPLDKVNYPTGIGDLLIQRNRVPTIKATKVLQANLNTIPIQLYSGSTGILLAVSDELETLRQSKSIPELVRQELVATDNHGYLYTITLNNQDFVITKHLRDASPIVSRLLPVPNNTYRLTIFGASTGSISISLGQSSSKEFSINDTLINITGTISELFDIDEYSLSVSEEDGVANTRIIDITFTATRFETTSIIPELSIQSIKLEGNSPTATLTLVSKQFNKEYRDIKITEDNISILSTDGVIQFLDRYTLEPIILPNTNRAYELELPTLLNINRAILSHTYTSNGYLVLALEDKSLLVIDYKSLTTFASIPRFLGATDFGSIVDINIIVLDGGDILSLVTENFIYLYSLVYESDKFTTFKYGSKDFVGVSKQLSEQIATHIGWYSEILPGQLPKTPYRTTAIIADVVFKTGVNELKNVFTNNEIESYKVVYVDNHVPQIPDKNSYKLLKIAREF